MKSIGSHAFLNCTSLTSVTIPDGVERIGEHAFMGCNIRGLTTSIGSAEKLCYPKDKNILMEKANATRDLLVHSSFINIQGISQYIKYCSRSLLGFLPRKAVVGESQKDIKKSLYIFLLCLKRLAYPQDAKKACSKLQPIPLELVSSIFIFEKIITCKVSANEVGERELHRNSQDTLMIQL